MNILTEEEIKALYNASELQPYYWLDGEAFARAIEAKILSKLAEQEIEPVGYLYSDDPAAEIGKGME